jgi:hypothetical protein
MGSWYWIGVSLGFGAAVGVLFAAFTGEARKALVVAMIAAGGVGAAIGYGLSAWQTGGWVDRLGGILGGLAGAFAAAQIVGGALRRGGTRGGTAILVAGAAIAVAAAALIPAVGYLEAVALPALAVRLRRARPERYAGLRTLARDD